MDQPDPVAEPTPPPAPVPTTSLAARMLNVFAIPGEVFEEIKASPASVANWLVPVLLFAFVGAVAACVIFSQPAIQQQLREQQAKALDKQVADGRLTREQADQAQAIAERFMGATMLRIFGSVGALFAGFVHAFWWALVIWLIGRWFLQVRFAYLKALEVTGLTMMIMVLGTLVGLLLTVNLARMFATPSLGLLVRDFDVSRKSHLFLGATNAFSIWLVALMSLGLGKLAGVPALRAALPILAYWVLQESVLIMIGLGQMAL